MKKCFHKKSKIDTFGVEYCLECGKVLNSPYHKKLAADITLKEIIKLSKKNNKRHNWTKLSALESLMLVVSECAEACECIRNGDTGLHYRDDGKPEGLISELADIIIRACNLTGIDIPQDRMIEAVQNKLKYNFKRPINHGRKI